MSGWKTDARSLPRGRMLVDVLLLGIVQAHQGLDRLDHALGVTDEVAVCVGGRQVPGEAVDEAREVQDLAVRAAHGAEPAGAIVSVQACIETDGLPVLLGAPTLQGAPGEAASAFV
jgi:hypothetical protein